MAKLQITKTQLRDYIKEEINESLKPMHERKPLQEIKFLVSTDDIGDIMITGKSEAEIRTRLIKKIRGGKDAILSIRRISRDKADQTNKRLGIEPVEEQNINEANPNQIKRMFASRMQRIIKTLNIIKKSLEYLEKRQNKNPADTKALLFLSNFANKLEDLEASINEFPQKNFSPPSR